MVSSITSFGRSGLYDWVVQRVSAVILLAYILFVLGFLLTTPNVEYLDWQALFAKTWVRIFSLISLLSLCAHAWVGLWTIATDYLTPMALGAFATKVRFLFLLVCIIILFTYFFWCVQILWSI